MDLNDMSDEEFDEIFNFSLEELEWHRNIFNFVNPNNILYIPEQHFLI